MRKLFCSLFVFVFGFLVLSVSPSYANVLSNQSGTVTVAKNEVINDDLFVGAPNVEIDGVVNGNVFVGANSVRITGTVNGSLHVGASTVILSGVVKNNAYVAAANITITKAKIGDTLLAGSGNMTVDKDTTIGGSLLVGGGNINVDAQVKRNAFVGAGNASFGPGAKISKDLYYAVGDNGQGGAVVSSDATVGGSIHKSVYEVNSTDMENAKAKLASFMVTAKIISVIVSFLGTIILGILYIKFFSNHIADSSDLFLDSFWKSFGTGLLVAVAFVPAIILLLLTGIGIPLAGVALLLVILGFSLSKLVVGNAIGVFMTRKFNWRMNKYLTFVLGIVVACLIGLVPFVGCLAMMVATFTGLGALTLKSFFNK
jgi:hypothetical protein